MWLIYLLVEWYNAFVFRAGGQRFKTRAGQIRRSIANGSPPLQHFFKRSCAVWMQWRGDRPRQLVTRFGIIQRVQWGIFDLSHSGSAFSIYYLHSSYRLSRAYRVAKWHHINKLETNILCFFLWFICSRICRFVQSAWLFLHGSLVLWICPIKSVENEWPQKTFATKAKFFLQCFSLFLPAFVSGLLIKSGWCYKEHCAWSNIATPGRRDFFRLF